VAGDLELRVEWCSFYNRRNCFPGRVKSGNMYLSDSENMADLFWPEIPGHFPFV
jgi:hypothetical protein